MLRSIFIPTIISLLALFNFMPSDVSLNFNMPEFTSAGSEFLVELTINKGDVEGFARFQQELPVGFKAVARETANGKFSFENQKVKIQWMKLPADREFKISYSIEVGPMVSGNFDFKGKFDYIINNEAQTAIIPIKAIKVIGDESAAETMASANTTYSYQDVSLKKIDCIRQKPYLNDDNEVVVNLLVNKGSLKDFGKIQEQIPSGYKAVSLRSKNSIFTAKNQIVKFLWMNMPKDEQFMVSYKLVPEGEVPDQAFLIEGSFSYAESKRTKIIDIAERAVDMSSFSGDELVANNSESVQTKTDPVKISSSGATVYSEEDLANYTQANPVEVSSSVPTTSSGATVYSEGDLANYAHANTSSSQGSTSSHSLPSLTNIPMPENGVAYKVQVAAGHKLVDKKYFKKLNITDEVQTEIHEGWHKYTIGNFKTYVGARDYRVYVWNNTPVNDAFVAAYNSGLRITVQEALMITNQKWYR